MRYMMIMNVTPEGAFRAAEEMDMAAMFAAMNAYNEDMRAAGVFLSAEGLSDAAEGFRVDFDSTPPAVTDGPFAEAREVFNGYWIIEVASAEEARHWALKCPVGPGVTLEVRRINELADFDLPDSEGLRREQEWQAANG